MQGHLFQILRNKIPQNARLSEVIADLLSISIDSAYRRIRCEKELTLNELKKVCVRFNISMDHLLAENLRSSSLWYHSIGKGNVEAYYEYLESIVSAVELISMSRKSEMCMLVSDVSIFHKFPYADLMWLEMFKWYRAMNGASPCFEEFRNMADGERLNEIAVKFQKSFTGIPRTELWSAHSLDSLLSDIEYYSETGIISRPATCAAICEQVSEMLESIRDGITERDTGSFLGHTNLRFHVLPSRADGNAAYFRYDGAYYTLLSNFNSYIISSTDRIVGQDSERWIKQLIGQSSLISGTAERERYRFFHHLEGAVGSVMQKVGSPIH